MFDKELIKLKNELKIKNYKNLYYSEYWYDCVVEEEYADIDS